MRARLVCLYALARLLSAAYEVLDVEAVRAVGDPAAWVRTVAAPATVEEVSCDILVAGAGAGGFAAALRAASRGHTVCLTEESGWIGGQITAAGVSALDENRFIEISGGTRTYYDLRRRIRDYYRTRFTLAPHAAALPDFNPGSCYVSPLCFEPKAGLAALEAMLPPGIRLWKRSKVVDLEMNAGQVRAALIYGLDSGRFVRVRPRFVLDATETGDLLPLARLPYAVGAEAAAETGEPHAPRAANPACVQSFTYPFALEYRAGEDHRIPKPPGYERLRDAQRFTLRLNYPVELGWKGDVQYSMFGEDPPVPNNMSPRPFFTWRRLLAKRNFTGPAAPADLALINWPRQDYGAESLLERTPLEQARILQRAKQVSMAFLYWLQNEVPRDEGAGRGYPGLMLRADVMGTPDGLSRLPYIRESRRLRARTRVREQDIVEQYQTGPRARWYPDSVGTGFYMVDIHPCEAGERGRMMMPKPFQIPMGALIPESPGNLLPAGKNIGVTHLTNGSYRLHPIEWNVGEAAAVIASLAIRKGSLPEPPDVQAELAAAGVPLVWFDDLPPGHSAFAAIHLAAIRGLYPLSPADLHAAPEAPVTRKEAAQALKTLFGKDPLEAGWMATDHRNWFHPDLPFYWSDWRESGFPRPLNPIQHPKNGPVTRAEFAKRLVQP